MGSYIVDDDDLVDVTVNCNIALILCGLLAYTNIENDIIDVRYNDEVVDMLEMFGFIDYIKETCGKDYTKLERSFSHMIDFRNLQQLTNIFANIDISKISEFTAKINEAKRALTPEIVEGLREVARDMDPTTVAFAQSLSRSTMHNTLNHNEQKAQEVDAKTVQNKAGEPKN